MKTRNLVPVVLVIVLLLSGCNLVPNLKNLDEVSPPSWDVNVRLPLIKATGNLGDAVKKVEELELDTDTNTFSFSFSTADNPDLDLTVPLPELAVNSDVLAFDAFNWNQGAIEITTGVVPFDISLMEYNEAIDFDGHATLDFDYYANSNKSIQIPFNRAKLSNSENNKITFTLTTNEPLDEFFITLTDLDGVQIPGTNQIHVTELGGADYVGEVTMPEIEESYDISLAGCDLPDKMNFKVSLQAHSTSGSINLGVQVSNQLEIVEVEGFDPAALGISIPDITIPEIKPLASLIGINNVTLESGKIYLNEEKIWADENDRIFPFKIQIENLLLDGVDLMKEDESGRYIDFAGVTLTPESAISGTVGVTFEDNFVYDVWDEVEGLKNYEYNLNFSMTDIVARSISGDISELVPDPSPETPDWDFQLEEIGTGIVETPYPEEIGDFTLGLKDIFLNLNIDNQTSFVGNLNMSLKAFEDEEGLIPAKNETNENMEASFILALKAREVLDFSLQDQDDYQTFIDIINSKPAYISFGITGGLGLSDDFIITSDDYITPSASITLPLAFTVPAGGAQITDIFNEEMTLEQSQRDTIDQISDFITEASLHIKYNNKTTFGLGGIFTFSTPEGKEVKVEAILYPEREDEVIFTIDTVLTEVLSNETGFNINLDVVIPNDSDTEHVVKLQPTDTIDCTIWVDGKINVHLPEEL